MGIIPAAAFDVALTYGDALLMPHPAALAAALAALAVIGLHLLGNSSHAPGAPHGAGGWPRPARAPVAALAVLPRLPQRVPQTRTPRPAPGPAVAACLLMRGPPDSQRRLRPSSTGVLPR